MSRARLTLGELADLLVSVIDECGPPPDDADASIATPGVDAPPPIASRKPRRQRGAK